MQPIQENELDRIEKRMLQEFMVMEEQEGKDRLFIEDEKPDVVIKESTVPEKKVILCSICEYVLLNRIGICHACHDMLKMTKITDKLYLTNFKNAQNYGDLVDRGIKQILVVGNDMLHRTESLKTKYIYIDDCATDDIAQYFEEAHEFIKTDVTVVHCYAGISRSPAVVISFLMKEHGMSLDEAFDLCKQKRPIVNPNDGFLQQLRDYDMELQLLRE